jgi:hypothetical protein
MHSESYLREIVIIISIAVFVVAVFKKLKLSPVLGYFVAGGLLGEHGMQVVTSGETDGVPNMITISADQYECHRTWTTTAGAQNWLDMIDGLATQVDVVCLEKRLEP